MDYKEANRRLRLPFGDITAISPNNRCIWKSLAISKGAVLVSPFNQSTWDDNRLLPVDPNNSSVAFPYMYLITFDPYNGDPIVTIRVPSGTTPSYPGGRPSKNGYTFNGWSPTIEPAAEDKTYTAQWTNDTPTTYTITWLDENGNQISQSTGVTSTDNVYTLIPSYTIPAGYQLDGWYVYPGMTTKLQNGDTISGNITYKVKLTSIVNMLAEVFWKTDSDGGGLVHNDPGNNMYEDEVRWLQSDTSPIHLRFEPMYKTGANGVWTDGTELGYTDTIATVNGINVRHEDLEFDVLVGDPANGYNGMSQGTANSSPTRYDFTFVFRTLDNTYQTAADSSTITLKQYVSGDFIDDGYIHRGHGMAVTSNTRTQNFYYKDKITITYIAKVKAVADSATGLSDYDGTEVYRRTITILVWGPPATLPPYNAVDNDSLAEGTLVGKSVPGADQNASYW